MPGTRCAIAECVNARYKDKNLSFHRFPRDQSLRNQWIVICKRKDEFNPATSHVCSDHFDEEDFESDLKQALMNTPTRKRLKSGIVPHKNLSRSAFSQRIKKTTDRSRSKTKATNRGKAEEKNKERGSIIEKVLLSCPTTSETQSPNLPQEIDKPDYEILYKEVTEKHKVTYSTKI